VKKWSVQLYQFWNRICINTPWQQISTTVGMELVHMDSNASGLNFAIVSMCLLCYKERYSLHRYTVYTYYAKMRLLIKPLNRFKSFSVVTTHVSRTQFVFIYLYQWLRRKFLWLWRLRSSKMSNLILWFFNPIEIYKKTTRLN
jgi:hypothetical protein